MTSDASLVISTLEKEGGIDLELDYLFNDNTKKLIVMADKFKVNVGSGTQN